MKKGRVRNFWINIELEDCQARCYQDENLDSQEKGTICQGSARRQLWQNSLGKTGREKYGGKKMAFFGKRPGMDDKMTF